MTKPSLFGFGSTKRAENLVPKSRIVAPKVPSAGSTAFFDKRSWFRVDFGQTYPLDAAPSETSLARHAPHKALAAGQPPVNVMESLKRRTMSAEDQFQTTPGLHQSSGQVHEFLNHGLDPAPFGGMAHRGFPVHKPELSNGAQDVVGQPAKGQDQGVGGEFSRRQPFQIHVGFDLTVELLTRSMILIKPDHVLFGQIQSGPPSFQFDLRHKKKLPLSTDGALHRPHHSFKPIGLPFVNLQDMNGEESDSFSGARSADRTLLKNPPGPFPLVLFAGIPFDDVVDILIARQGHTGFQSVVGRIQANQEFSRSQGAGFVQDPLE